MNTINEMKKREEAFYEERKYQVVLDFVEYHLDVEEGDLFDLSESLRSGDAADLLNVLKELVSKAKNPWMICAIMVPLSWEPKDHSLRLPTAKGNLGLTYYARDMEVLYELNVWLTEEGVSVGVGKDSPMRRVLEPSTKKFMEIMAN